MLHKRIKLALFGLISVIMTGCSGHSSKPIEDSIEYLAVQLREGKSWSFVDSKGKIVSEAEFKNMPTSVFNGMFSVKEDETYSLYNINNLRKEILSGLYSVGVYNEDVIPLSKINERIMLVDKNGKLKSTFEPVDGKEIIACGTLIRDGRIRIVNEDGKWGFADASGKVKIKPQYDAVFPFSEGLALVVKAEENGEERVSAIDKSGKQVFSLNTELSLISIPIFKDGLIPVENNEKGVCGFINKKGEFTKVSGKVGEIGDYNSKLFAYKNRDNEWGIMDMNDETIVRAKYDMIKILPNGNFLAAQRGDVNDKNYDYFILNKNGEKKIEIDEYKYKSIESFNNETFYFIGQTSKKYVILNEEGKQIGEEDFANINYNGFSDWYVQSDYFDPETVANALTDCLEMSGIGKCIVGKAVSTLDISDYDNYVWSTHIENLNMDTQGWRFSTRVMVETNEPIAYRSGEYDAFYNWNSYVVPNSDAKIEKVSITANVQKPCWNKIKYSLTNKIQSLGYTMTESNEDRVEFNGNNCTLTLFSTNDEKNITISISTLKRASAKTGSVEADLVETIDW